VSLCSMASKSRVMLTTGLLVLTALEALARDALADEDDVGGPEGGCLGPGGGDEGGQGGWLGSLGF